MVAALCQVPVHSFRARQQRAFSQAQESCICAAGTARVCRQAFSTGRCGSHGRRCRGLHSDGPLRLRSRTFSSPVAAVKDVYVRDASDGTPVLTGQSPLLEVEEEEEELPPFTLGQGWADPSPENLLALLLTAVAALAVLRIVWDLLLGAVLITLTGVKYLFVAAALVTALVLLI